MNISQNLEDFYKQRLAYIPTELDAIIGHFNVFNMEQFSGKNAKPIHYTRKNYYKISLLTGKKKLTYADKVIIIDKHALIFTNPLIPYNWELLEEEQSGFFCIFTINFFHQFGQINQYPVFQPNHIPVFILNDEQHEHISYVFSQMINEYKSDYTYKEDRLRQLTFELIHLGIKMAPAHTDISVKINADSRIYNLFIELLERQFPVEENSQMALKTPADFAKNLYVHINHLNRTLRKITGKTTSNFINERIAKEAAFMLKFTSHSIKDIAWKLGFDHVSSFNHFFRKHLLNSPNNFRKDKMFD